jgi:hypothetical protein
MLKKQRGVGGLFVSLFISAIFLLPIGCNKHLQMRHAEMAPKMSHSEATGTLIANWQEKTLMKKPIEGVKGLYDYLVQLENAGMLPGGGSAKDIKMLSFIRTDGRIFIADMMGNEVKPCGRIDGSVVRAGACKELKNTNIVRMSSEMSIVTQNSPGCTTRSIDGWLVQICD